MSEALAIGIPEQLVEAIAKRVAELVGRDCLDEQRPNSPWLDFEGACTYLGFSRHALYRLTAARAVPVRKKLNGQGLRFHRGELDAWMEEHYPRLDHLP